MNARMRILLIVFVLASVMGAYTIAARATLIAHYKLDESAAGPVVNQVGFDGTNNGATINQIGQVNQAYAFNGTFGVYADIPEPVVGSGPFSVAAWINPADLSGASAPWGMGIVRSTENTGVGDYALTVDNDGALHFLNWREAGTDSDGNHRSADGLISTSQWTHVAATWDGTDNHLYVNGSEVTIAASDSTSTGWGVESSIGRLWINDVYAFDGLIDDVGVWTETIGASRISEIYVNGLNGLDLSVVPPPIPEPSSATLLGLGGLALLLCGRGVGRHAVNATWLVDKTTVDTLHGR